MNAKETVKYLHEHGHTVQHRHYETITQELARHQTLIAKYDTLKDSHANLVKILVNLVKAGETNSRVEEELPWTLEQAKQALKEAQAL